MKHASASISLGGHIITAAGSPRALQVLASDFATEHVLMQSGSLVAKRALSELHDLLANPQLTTEQKRHVDAAIAELKKIGPVK